MSSFCKSKSTPDDRVAGVFANREAVVDAVAAEDFQGLLERIGAGAGQPETQDLERARAGPVGFRDGVDDVVERLHTGKGIRNGSWGSMKRKTLLTNSGRASRESV